MTSDSGALRALYQRLFNDSILYGLADGEIHSDLPEGEVKEHLAKEHRSCVSVSLPDASGYGRLGCAHSHTEEKLSIFQVDAASRYGSSAVYARKIAERVDALVYQDVEEWVGSDYYVLGVKDVHTTVFEDAVIQAWHAVIRITAEYTLHCTQHSV